MKSENEKADRGPYHTLENPGDRPDGEVKPIRQHIVRHKKPSVHANSRPGRPRDHSNDQCRHRESTRPSEIREVFEKIVLTSLG